MLINPHERQVPTLLGTLANEDGTRQRYLGYTDGVYEQLQERDGAVGQARPYAPWSTWPTSAAASSIAAQQRYNLDEAT